MKYLFRRIVRLLVLPVLIGLGIYTGGADGIIGWLFLAWMLFRGGPAMWADVKNAFRWVRGGVRFRRGRSAYRGDLNV